MLCFAQDPNKNIIHAHLYTQRRLGKVKLSLRYRSNVCNMSSLKKYKLIIFLQLCVGNVANLV